VRHPLRARRAAHDILDDEAVEAVFDHGSLPAGHALEDLANLMGLLVADYGSEPVPEPNADLAAVLEQGAGTLHQDPPAVAEVLPSERAARPRWFGITLRPVFLAGLAVAASVIVLGGLAVAGQLPAPVQRAVADAASELGIELPGRTAANEPEDTTNTRPVGETREPDAGTQSGPDRDGGGGAPASVPTSLAPGNPTGEANAPEATPAPPSPTTPPTSPPTTLPTLPSVTLPTLPPVTAPRDLPIP
jgi:hypothetical protein